MRTIQNRSRIFGLVVAGLEPAAMGVAHLALPSSELHDHINCFRAGETHAQLRSECGSYIVRARSLTKLATSAPDQLCDGSLILLQISLITSFGSVDLSQTENALSIGENYELKLNYQINLHIGGSSLN